MKENEDKPLYDDIPKGLRLLRTLKGHNDHIYRLAWSPDGKFIASPSRDTTARIWNAETGEMTQIIDESSVHANCVSWSSDGKALAIGYDNGLIIIWDIVAKRIKMRLVEQKNEIWSVAWSPNGNWLAAVGNYPTISIWYIKTGNLYKKIDINGYGSCLAWSQSSRSLIVGTLYRILLISTDNFKIQRKIKGHSFSVAWFPNETIFAASGDDNTIRIYDSRKGQLIRTLEGHKDSVISVAISYDGLILASKSVDNRVFLWSCDTWNVVAKLEEESSPKWPPSVAFSPTEQQLATLGNYDRIIRLWEFNYNDLLKEDIIAPNIHYINAKVVLVGDSGVGKSGLGIRIAEDVFRYTESTHGAQFWHLPVREINGLSTDLHAEITLWDLAGQPEYRLTHQLFLDDVDAALLLFDCSDPNDPFHGVSYWAKVLKKQASENVIKYLVSARCDVSTVTADQSAINNMLAKYGLHGYIKTSAKSGEGVKQLFQQLVESIPWQELPRTSTPQLFQSMRGFILERKAANDTLIGMDTIQREAIQIGSEIKQLDIDAVVKLLQAHGLVYRLDIPPSVSLVLTRPELINQYASSIIQAARNHPLGIGAVLERDVLIGNIPISGFVRMPRDQERIILEATAELLIQHDLCFREMGLLIFPSQINVTRPELPDIHPRTEVVYRFSGGIETIYASLVVRLSHTNYFRREAQWKYAAEFSREGKYLGFSMHQVEEGTSDLEVYFHAGISDFDRVTFIRFITDHLRTKGIEIQEEIRLYCSKCGEEVTNRKAIMKRIKQGSLDIPCQFCGEAVLIPRSIEERYEQDNDLAKKQKELQETVGQRMKVEIEQLREDQHYVQENNNEIHILHLSDLHLENSSQAQVYLTQLETDLIKEMKIKHLEYLVISGDISNHATEDEYQFAFEMLDSLVKHFGLNVNRVVIVPGNHDLNWDESEAAYLFVSNRKRPVQLSKERCIPAGDAGVLLRDESLYQLRFLNFNREFYKRMYSNTREYPIDYSQQAILTERPEDRILFLALNSSWQIDHHFKNRSSINIEALSKALDCLRDEKYNNWLKIGVWHHPVAGKEMMNDEFLELLKVHEFQICMHGHIHEAIEDYHKHDDKRGIFIIGAGTFGAPAGEQTPGIPLQYNLLTFDPDKGEMIVNTRKKEKSNGAWSADARWGDKKNPRSWYSFIVKNYHSNCKG